VERAAALEAVALPHPLVSQASPVEAEERAVRADTQGAAARPLLLPAGMGQDGMGDGVDTADGAAALEDGRRPNGKLPHGMVDGPILLLPLLVPPHPARRPHHQAAVESLASQAVESLARAVDGNKKDPVFEMPFLPRSEKFCWRNSFGTILACKIPGCLVDIKCHHMERLLLERECVKRDLTLVPTRQFYLLFM